MRSLSALLAVILIAALFAALRAGSGPAAEAARAADPTPATLPERDPDLVQPGADLSADENATARRPAEDPTPERNVEEPTARPLRGLEDGELPPPVAPPEDQLLPRGGIDGTRPR